VHHPLFLVPHFRATNTKPPATCGLSSFHTSTPALPMIIDLFTAFTYTSLSTSSTQLFHPHPCLGLLAYAIPTDSFSFLCRHCYTSAFHCHPAATHCCCAPPLLLLHTPSSTHIPAPNHLPKPTAATRAKCSSQACLHLHPRQLQLHERHLIPPYCCYPPWVHAFLATHTNAKFHPHPCLGLLAYAITRDNFVLISAFSTETSTRVLSIAILLLPTVIARHPWQFYKRLVSQCACSLAQLGHSMVQLSHSIGQTSHSMGQLNGNAQRFNGAAQSLNASAQSLIGSAPSLHGSTQQIGQSLNGSAQSLNGSAQSLNGSAQSLREAARSAQ
jgi:hypothetical protein